MQPRPWPRLFQLFHIFVFAAFCRIGEATNPGPQGEWTLGCMNPTGVMHKSSTLTQLPARGKAVWGISETHLTKPGVVQFRKELHFSGSSYQFFPGAPAPFKSSALSAIGGKQTGTGFLTSFPSRALTPTWPSEPWDTARFCAQTFLVEHEWIHGAVIYGPAHSAASQQGKQTTDELLAHITRRIVQQCAGKRFIMGDFNQIRTDMQEVALWESLGWKEVQIWRLEKYGIPIDVTCRGTTTKDFIYVSPELLPWLTAVEVIPDLYPDHSVVAAHFKPLGPPAKIALWKKPRPIQWTAQQQPVAAHEERREQCADPDEECTAIAKAFEHRIQQHRAAHKQTSLHPSQCGRSLTKEVVWKQEYTNPLRPSRSGDAQPKFGGISLQFNRWFRQLRRIECYTRLSAQLGQTVNQLIHRDRLWRAIMQAPGFPGGFANWWLTIPKTIDAPATLTWNSPDSTTAHGLQIAFDRELRNYEATLINDRINTSRVNRAADPGIVFRDVRKPSVNPVQILQTSAEAEIVQVDIETGIVQIDRPSPFDPQQPVLTATTMQQIVHVEDKDIAIPDAADCIVGQTLRQEKFIGDLTSLFQAFAQEWHARWDKHRTIPASHWDPIVNFFRDTVPPGPAMPYNHITLEAWFRALARKKKRAATGPDGWARQDLLHLPSDLTQDLLDLLHRIEAGQSWPTSVVTGIVFALEKLPEARLVTHYRPITVFSVIYRTWSTIRAKELLIHLQSSAPDTCFGNLPNRYAAQVWWNIQSLIESHNFEGSTISGSMMDVIKCFNHLPREPLLQMCLHLGAPIPVITAWRHALQQMTRRFSIRGSVGPSLMSSTGFAEGCGLSVVAMLVSNIALAAWIQHRAPLCTLWTFVDNIEITSPDVAATVSGLEQVTKFTELMDIQLDPSKTFVWSNSAEDRAWLRTNSHVVKPWARDLGGHVQYNKCSTNGVIVQKCASFQSRWRQFARSRAPQRAKVRAIRTVAWPNMFHGIASVHLGLDHFDAQRTQAIRGLCLQHSGTSPKLQLSLIEFPTADPEFYAIWRTVQEFRKNVTAEAATPIFDELTAKPQLRPPPGPCSVLLHRLHRILWSWEGHGHFRDHEQFRIHLWHSPIQWITSRLIAAWQATVMGELSHRKTFKGFPLMCPKITLRKLTTHPVSRGIMQTALNGTFFTADCLAHRTPDADVSCKFCGQPDSQAHRHWHCTHFADVRPTCPPQVQHLADHMHLVTEAHGWIPAPPLQTEFVRALHALPDRTAEFVQSFCRQGNCVNLFTDGGALTPNDPATRLASWGVVAADTGSWDFKPISCGLLPGGHQTVLRAEITAALSAMKFAQHTQQPFRLWIDNAEVVRNICHWMKQSTPIATQHTDHELWSDLADWLRRTAHLCAGVIKVFSHQTETDVSEAEVWAFTGNEAADTLAATAFHEYPHIKDLHSNLVEQTQTYQTFQNHVHSTLTAVGNKAMDARHIQTRDALEEAPAENPARALPSPSKWPFLLDSDQAHRQYRITTWPQIFSWVDTLSDEASPPVILSWHQLFADYMICTQTPGPWYNRSRKKWEPLPSLDPKRFPAKTRWFATYLIRFAKSLERPIPILHCRPSSCVLAFWTSCVLVRLHPARVEAMDKWFLTWRPIYRRPTDLHVIGDD